MRGRAEEHGLDVVEAHGAEDDREEVGKRVARDGGGHEEVAEEPDLPVHEVLADLGECHGVGLGVGAVALDASENHVLLLIGEESGAVGEVDDEHVAEEADDDGHNAVHDEHPGPAAVSAEAVHQGEAVADGSAGGADEAGEDEEARVADGHLLARVPAANEEGCAGEECALKEAEDGTEGRERLPVPA